MSWVKPSVAEIKQNFKQSKISFPEIDSIQNVLYDYMTKINHIESTYKKNTVEEIEQYYEDKEAYEALFAQAMKLLFLREEVGDIFLVEDFISSAKNYGFIPYDGSGFYIDFFGNQVGNIDWDNLDNCPDEAVFVVWYNK